MERKGLEWQYINHWEDVMFFGYGTGFFVLISCGFGAIDRIKGNDLPFYRSPFWLGAALIGAIALSAFVCMMTKKQATLAVQSEGKPSKKVEDGGAQP